MSESVQIRHAIPDDAVVWARMRQALWPEEDAAALAAEVDRFFGGGLAEPLAVLLAEDEAGRPLGMAEVSIRSYAEGCETDRVAYLEAWYVEPGARQQGVGRALIEASEQWALSQGCRELASDALVGNDVSIQAHQALGFEPADAIQCFRKTIPGAAVDARAATLIAQLGLHPHPEGGHFAEVFRSSVVVTPEDDRGPRMALTTIYYLLRAGEISRWHRVRSDEVWHFYEGGPLELLVISPDMSQLTTHLLGPVRGRVRPTATVAANAWQAARPLGDYALVGCTVGPGFDFSDFAMARDEEGAAAAIRSTHPAVASLL